MLGNLRLARLLRYLVGTQKLTLRFDHQEHSDIVRNPEHPDWAGSEERYSTHAGLALHGGHLVDSWVASDQVRALSPRESELYGIVDGSDEPSTLMSRRIRRQRSGCATEQALERQDAYKSDGCGSKTPFGAKSCVRSRHGNQ